MPIVMRKKQSSPSSEDIRKVRHFIEYIHSPIRTVEKNLKPGERINGMYMSGVSRDLAPYSNEAQDVLEAFNRLFPE